MIKKKDQPSVGNEVMMCMELKDKIINSAYELFSMRGYEKTTIEEIIKQAECSKGGFYHHFKSKEEILEVIIANYIADLTKFFEDIVLNEKDSFIDKFNAVFSIVSRYKSKQLIEWSKINNVFCFVGNDKILRQLEKQFKIATTRTYLEVLSKGKEQEVIKVQYPEILAELCTRQILWIYEAAGKDINPEQSQDNDEMFERLLDFSEGIISHALGLRKHEVMYKDVAMSYRQNAREFYLANTRRDKDD